MRQARFTDWHCPPGTCRLDGRYILLDGFTLSGVPRANWRYCRACDRVNGDGDGPDPASVAWRPCGVVCGIELGYDGRDTIPEARHGGPAAR